MTENIKAAKRPTSLLRMFNLRDDLDHPEEIDDAIRSGSRPVTSSQCRHGDLIVMCWGPLVCPCTIRHRH